MIQQALRKEKMVEPPPDPDYTKFGTRLPPMYYCYLQDRQTGEVAKHLNLVPPKKPPPVFLDPPLPVAKPAAPPTPKADPGQP